MISVNINQWGPLLKAFAQTLNTNLRHTILNSDSHYTYRYNAWGNNQRGASDVIQDSDKELKDK